jgi:hypothetical protein
MRSSWLLSLPALLALGGSGLAAEGADVTAVQTAAPVSQVHALPRIGLMADAGLPDGVNASLVYRPARWVRAHVGGGYNLISSGVRAGVTLAPFGWGPSATLEGGHYFDGNANGVARKFAGAGFKDNDLLERVGYDYVNAHLGFEIGYRRVTFYVHGGMSYIRASVHNLDSVVQSQAMSNGADASGLEISIKQDPTVKVLAPSAKLGLLVYLW